MTVEEYLAFAAELKKIPKGKIRVMMDEIMNITGLLEMRSRLIRNLSKGYRQRTGLAQAILGYPKIIILDEPMVGLDPKQIIEIRDLIRELGKNHTVILSSHILSEVSAVCDQIMIISHGKLAANDTPENLEKLMEGSNTLNLTVKGDALSLQRILKQTEGILSCSVTSSEEKEALDVVIKTETGLDLRERLFYLLADLKMPILSLQQSRVSLETVFLELTGEEPSESPEKPAAEPASDSDERSEDQ